MNKNDKVRHPSHGEEVGTVSEVWGDGSFLVRFSDGEFSFPDDDYTFVEAAPQKLRIRSGQQTSFTEYSPWAENRKFFELADFATTGLQENPAYAYWLAGWFEKRGRLEEHEPVRGTEGVQDRGATLHVIFPNPEFPGLDLKIGEFFDPYRKGWIQINSRSAYDFFLNFSNNQVPLEFKSAYDQGTRGIPLLETLNEVVRLAAD